MHAQLVKLVFAFWAAMPWPWNQAVKSPDARDVADGIAVAVEREAANVGSPASGESYAVDAAWLAEYAARESNANEHPIASSWDAKAGLSLGVWQMRWYLVKNHSLAEQAGFWLDAVRRAGVVGADSSYRRAEWRKNEARHVLAQALQDVATQDVAARQDVATQ